MNNENIQHIIAKALTETASAEELNTLQAWLKSDEEHKKLYFEMKTIFDARKAAAYYHPENLQASWQTLAQKIDEKEHRRKGLTRRLFIRYAGAAAAILLLLSTALFITMNNHRTANKQWVEVYNEPGQMPKTIGLPDGSEVKLNAASRLKYPEHFSANKREVHLTGEALFTVARNEQKPFIVHSDLQEITVLGTVFNVNSYASSTNSETTLISGKVKLSIKDKAGQVREEIILTKNRQVRFNKSTLESEVKSVDAQNIIAWTSNEYIFKNKPLVEILERLSTIYNVTFIANSGQKHEKYTCKFSAGQSLNDVLSILNFKNQFSYTITNDTIKITDK